MGERENEALQKHLRAELAKFLDVHNSDALTAADTLCALCEAVFDVNNPKCPQQFKQAILAYKKARYG